MTPTHCSHRLGLTRIDVITLGLLAIASSALMLGCVNSAEETKRQSACRDNLRGISQSVLLYASRTPIQEFPGYINVLKRDDGAAYHDPRTGRVEPVSWAVLLLQEFDRAPLYRQWRSVGPPSSDGHGTAPPIASTHVYLDLLVCPNDATSPATGTPLSYAVNCGIPDFPATDRPGTAPALPPPRTVCECPQCGNTREQPQGGRQRLPPRDNLANGVFFDGFTGHPLVSTSVFGMQINTLHSITDPKDKTILLAENVDAVNYTFDAPKPDAPTAEEIYPTTERQLGIVWAPDSRFVEGLTRPEMAPPRESFKINVDAGQGNGSSYDHARPSSKHPGGVNMAFVGGNVLFMKETLSYFVFVKLMTSSDERAETRDAEGNRARLPTSFVKYGLGDADLNP